MGVGTHAVSGPQDQCFKVDLGQTFGWRCPDNILWLTSHCGTLCWARWMTAVLEADFSGRWTGLNRGISQKSVYREPDRRHDQLPASKPHPSRGRESASCLAWVAGRLASRGREKNRGSSAGAQVCMHLGWGEPAVAVPRHPSHAAQIFPSGLRQPWVLQSVGHVKLCPAGCLLWARNS